jgi:hypothetical protein
MDNSENLKTWIKEQIVDCINNDEDIVIVIPSSEFAWVEAWMNRKKWYLQYVNTYTIKWDYKFVEGIQVSCEHYRII